MASGNGMASVLKRKRGTVEVVDAPKRTKAAQRAHNQTPVSNLSNTGFTLGPLERQDGLTTVNGVGSHSPTVDRISESPESKDYEEFIKKGQAPRTQNNNNGTTQILEWQVSAPIGGRMIDVDPVFTEDEKFIIVAHGKSIKVYSTSNSLLNLEVNLHIDSTRRPPVCIVAYSLSPTNSNLIWVACSDGTIYRIDWTSGDGGKRPWTTSSINTTQMTVSAIALNGQERDVVFTAEAKGDGWQISAHELGFLAESPTTRSRTIYTSSQSIQILKAVVEGDVIVAASEERILIGRLRSKTFESVEKLRYEFHVFESTEFISSMDFRIPRKGLALSGKTSKADKASIVDVVVGDVKGAIFVHNDLLASLIRFEISSAKGEATIDLLPRKFHWHRTGVPTVKWSLDGNYIISGGDETVMVLWQLDTGRQQFLPHLSAAVQNIVVSPRGTSYAVHLADNSTMILSTSELIPAANVAGIQARIMRAPAALNCRVRRVENERFKRSLMPRTPALINPRDPSRLLLAVGEVQELNPPFTKVLSTPFLQTFDIAYNHNISRQALSRTNVTNKLMGPDAHRICQAVVTHMQISQDGIWLVTVDEWLPPKRDVEFLSHGGMNIEDERCRRREVYLKFWQWDKSTESWGLVSRIDSPHNMAGERYGAGRVLALAANSSSLSFSTLGEDAVVQIWRPRLRKRDGVVIHGIDGEPLYTWSCHQRISLWSAELGDSRPPRTRVPKHACLAFSEDGSILAASISGRGDGVIHLIDPYAGTIRTSRPTMYRGELISLAFLAQYLIVLSEDLRVYDLVLNEQNYTVPLGDIRVLLSLDQKVEMTHLAVDRLSRTFAVALPRRDTHTIEEKKSIGSLLGADTEITVYQPEHAQPLYTNALPTLATALLPAISSAGYIVLDAAAEITTVSPKASQTLISMAKPMVELRLDIRTGEKSTLDLMQLADSAEEMEEAEINDAINKPSATHLDSTEEDDDGPTVVLQHQLTSIFDIGPSFTLPPIEELFYQVAGLLSRKPAPVQIS